MHKKVLVCLPLNAAHRAALEASVPEFEFRFNALDDVHAEDVLWADIVLGNNYKGDLYQRVLELAGKGRAKIYSCDTESLTRFFAAFSSGDRTRSFLKVQDGCDYKCAYCTIHYARGSSRNMPIADLVAEARTLAAAGTKEIVVTGINTGDFGRTTGESFVDHIRALDTVEGIER